jgi:hypothetical protein
MKMSEWAKIQHEANNWRTLIDILQGFGMAFLVLLLAGWFRPYF